MSMFLPSGTPLQNRRAERLRGMYRRAMWEDVMHAFVHMRYCSKVDEGACAVCIPPLFFRTCNCESQVFYFAFFFPTVCIRSSSSSPYRG